MNVPVNLQKAKCGSRPHFAFLLSEIKFDGIFANVKKSNVEVPARCSSHRKRFHLGE